ncbi:hypothetical protein PO909_011499 [Leuciscus waleckii]
MARPATFTGVAEDCSGFLLQCSLYFEMHSPQFTSDRAPVACYPERESARYARWPVQPWWQSNALVVSSLSDFLSHFKEVFGQTTSDLSVHDQLFNLRQAKNSVSTYTLQFRTLAAASGWNETGLLTAFRQGLNADIRQLMVMYDDSMGIENFIQRTIRVSQRLIAFSLPNFAAYPPPSAPSVALPAPEPMQVDSYHLTHAERQRRILNQLCLYCGREGHVITACPVRPPRLAVSTIKLPPKINYLSRTTVHILTPHVCVSAQALIDSGSARNFISTQLLLGCLLL